MYVFIQQIPPDAQVEIYKKTRKESGQRIQLLLRLLSIRYNLIYNAAQLQVY